MDTTDLSMKPTVGALALSSVGPAGEDSSWQERQSDVHDDGHDFVRSSIELLSDLETSLKKNQQALLSRDISSVERETQEQRRLQRALAELWVHFSGFGKETDSPRSNFVQSVTALFPELRAAQLRVQHLARVHLALLRRARRSLHAFSQLMKGSSVAYGLPASMNPSSAASWLPTSWLSARGTGKGPQCRA